MKLIFFLVLVIFTLSVFSQSQIIIPAQYYTYSKTADSLFKVKKFKGAGENYSLAFTTIGGKGLLNDRYNAACSWALANYTDSAFLNLIPIVEKLKYSNYYHITHDTSLISLHTDYRWANLIGKIEQNKKEEQKKLETLL